MPCLCDDVILLHLSRKGKKQAQTSKQEHAIIHDTIPWAVLEHLFWVCLLPQAEVREGKARERADSSGTFLRFRSVRHKPVMSVRLLFGSITLSLSLSLSAHHSHRLTPLIPLTPAPALTPSHTTNTLTPLTNFILTLTPAHPHPQPLTPHLTHSPPSP
jgi:hypothetical protein